MISDKDPDGIASGIIALFFVVFYDGNTSGAISATLRSLLQYKYAIIIIYKFVCGIIIR